MNKILKSIIFTILLFIAIIPSVVLAEDSKVIVPDYSWYGDSSKDEYNISTVEQLVALANIVNGKAEGINKDTFDGKTVNLLKNIDLTGVIWTPIGSSMYDHYPDNPNTKMFEGTFDGKYHTINGLSSKDFVALPEDISSGEHSFGLIGYGYGASVKNLNMTNVSISCSGEAGADGAGVAAVIGFYVPKHNAKSVIENVHLLSGKVQATNNMGGVVGYTEVYGDTVNIDITYRNCTNEAEVIADAREAGGILGLFQNASGHKGSLKFINCINKGNVTVNSGSSSIAASGILGKEQSYGYKKYEFKVYFEKCRNSGNITANGRTGSGVETHASGVGTVYYSNGSPVVVNHCINTGNITVTGGKADNFIDGVFAHPAIGEANLIDAILQNGSYSTGKITTPGTNVAIIKYDVNEAAGNEASLRITSGKNVTIGSGSSLTRAGYEFNGWNTKIDGTGVSYSAGQVVKFDSEATLYAQWKKTKNTWSAASIPIQHYTGKPIKPNVLVYNENGELISNEKYTLVYEKDEDCIKAGIHTVKVKYNNEEIELEYEIVKARQELNITTSTDIVEGKKSIEIIVSGSESEEIELICDDPDVIIKNNGNNSFTAIIPNKDNEYQFTAIYKKSNNVFESFKSYTVKGTKTDEIELPNTFDSLTKTILFIVVAVLGIGISIFVLKKVYKK